MKFSLYFFSADGDRRDEAKYDLLLEGARFADDQGFDAVWVPERHFKAFGGLHPMPCITLGVLAGVTKKIGLRAGSLVLPLHGPVRTAENWALLDNLSNGRIGFSLASGWHPDDYVIAPERYHRRRELVYEDIEIVKRLWSGETVELPGVDGKKCAISTLPHPKQKELPIWVTASSAMSWTKAGEIHANIFTSMMGESIEQLTQKIRLYRKHLVQSGADPRKKTVTAMVHTYLDNDLEKARETSRLPLRSYLQAYSNQFEGLQVEGQQGGKSDLVLDYSVQHYFKGNALIGDQTFCQSVTERLQKAGVTELACLIDFGIAPDLVKKSLSKLTELKEQITAKSLN
jgi:natural product biosynthesis luciferase-like monooxygenase protein